MDPVTHLDAAGRRRSPATLPGYHAGCAPLNKGRSYPADPPRVEEIVAVMRQAGVRPAGLRFRGLAVVLWRAAHAVEMAREGVPLNVIQRQLGHADLGITSVYLQGIDSGEIVDIVHGRRAPVIQAAVALGP